MGEEFRTETIFDALKSPLALIDDPERRAGLERYVEAARLPLERAVFDLLSGLTQAVDEQVADRYRVRLAYRPGALDLEVDRKEPREPTTLAETEWSLGDGETEKVTIRIPAELKEMVTQSAALAGISVNSWAIRAMAAAVHNALRGGEPGRGSTPPAHRGKGARLTGWIGEP